MPTNLTPLLEHYDAFGWIPTLRGALSLDLMGNPECMWGDADRFAAGFKYHDGFSSRRYVAATSLQVVADSKYGQDYRRCFRYFFVGAIHDPSSTGTFLKHIPAEIKEKKSGRPLKGS